MTSTTARRPTSGPAASCSTSCSQVGRLLWAVKQLGVLRKLSRQCMLHFHWIARWWKEVCGQHCLITSNLMHTALPYPDLGEATGQMCTHASEGRSEVYGSNANPLFMCAHTVPGHDHEFQSLLLQRCCRLQSGATTGATTWYGCSSYSPASWRPTTSSPSA